MTESGPDAVVQLDTRMDHFALLDVTNRKDKEGPAPRGSVQLDLEDALDYLDALKARFLDKRPDVYNNFLDTMKDFMLGVIDTPGVMDRISSLLRGHNDLIQEFNKFLPPGYDISCTPVASDTAVISSGTSLNEIHNGPDRGRREAQGDIAEFHTAIRFVHKIKTRYKNNPEKFIHFLEALRSYRKSQDFDDVYRKVEPLFRDAPDLLAEFKEFFVPVA
ncbi:hypothetical protein ACEPAI_107 [Sanghuangporus weigelae]